MRLTLKCTPHRDRTKLAPLGTFDSHKIESWFDNQNVFWPSNQDALQCISVNKQKNKLHKWNHCTQLKDRSVSHKLLFTTTNCSTNGTKTILNNARSQLSQEWRFVFLTYDDIVIIISYDDKNEYLFLHDKNEDLFLHCEIWIQSN